MVRKTIAYTSLPIDDPRLLQVVDTVRATHVNGGCFLYQFVPADVSLWDRTDRHQSGHQDWLLAFLGSKSVHAAAAAVRIPYPLHPLPQHTLLAEQEFENTTYELLYRGGAYFPFKGSQDDARRLSRRFVSAMLGERRDSVYIYRLDGPWTPWFCDVAWDCTIAVLNRAERRWSLFCVTDTD